MKKILILTAISLACSTIIFSTTVFAAEAFKPMTLKFANVVPQNSWFGQQHQLWANEVEKRTEGKIKLRIFWMESLVKWKDMLIGVQSGIADMGWVSSTYHPSNLPLYITLANPFNYRDDFVAATMAEFDTLDNEPNLRAEMERENLILVFPHIGGQM